MTLRVVDKPPPNLVRIRRALLSVSDKAGLTGFAKALSDRGVEIISTGGTATALAAAGIPVIPVERVTGFPEILDGRVKTLHPMVHGGLLARRDDESHQKAMRENSISGIDLVCVNLYPFEQTVAKEGVTFAEAVENIDIGGPSMVRSAAKNHAFVAIVTDPSQYDRVIGEFVANDASLPLALREELAGAAFALTARYDAAISAYMHARKPATETSRRFPPTLTLSFVKVEDLRYGENPHQAAALYRSMTPTTGPSVVGATQLHGKELSYNNVGDAAAALELARALTGVARTTKLGSTAACVVKHSNPCGAAIAQTAADAVDEAILGDPLAAYGGIVALSTEVDGPAAARMCRSDVFLEVLIAPSFSQAAIDQLTKRWANLRLLAVGELEPPTTTDIAIPAIRHAFVPGGILAQEQDTRLATPAEIALKAGPAPSDRTLAIVTFMEAVCRALTSNAVAIGGESRERPGAAVRLFGAGAGQMDRVASCKLCVKKAGELAKGAVAFSDAFFPFKDGPEVLIKAGVGTIAHPGGSKRDQETFDACTAAGITCLVTGLRHFRH